MHSSFDKVAMLRAKKKCEDNVRTKKVRINSCDSHDARVAKINARFILSRLPKCKDFIVSANGVIRQKQSAEDGTPKEEVSEETTPTSEHVAAEDIINNDDEAALGEDPTAPESKPKTPERPNAEPKGGSGQPKKPESQGGGPKKTPKPS